MKRSEFSEWMRDFSGKFPDTAEWALGKQVWDTWFLDCFSLLDLSDCLEVTRLLFREGGIEAYARERLPAHYLRHAGEMRWKREQAARQREERAAMADRVSAHAVMTEQSMRWAFAQAVRFKSHVDRVKWIAQYFDSDDPIMTADEFVSEPSQLKDGSEVPSSFLRKS